MKKIWIVLSVFAVCSLIFTACAKSDKETDGEGVLQNPAVSENVYTTTITVDGCDLRLGMSEAETFLYNDKFIDYPVSSGIVCDHIKMRNCWELNYYEEVWSVDVLGEQAHINAFFMVGLQELFIAWNDLADEDALLDKLKSQYGEDYTMDTIFYAGYQSAYRWDLSDGSSLFFLPMDREISREFRKQKFKDDDDLVFYVGPCLFMVPTKDITEIQIQKGE